MKSYWIVMLQDDGTHGAFKTRRTGTLSPSSYGSVWLWFRSVVCQIRLTEFQTPSSTLAAATVTVLLVDLLQPNEFTTVLLKVTGVLVPTEYAMLVVPCPEVIDAPVPAMLQL